MEKLKLLVSGAVWFPALPPAYTEAIRYRRIDERRARSRRHTVVHEESQAASVVLYWKVWVKVKPMLWAEPVTAIKGAKERA